MEAAEASARAPEEALRVWPRGVVVGVAFAVALLARGAVIASAPRNYAFDAYQRWAGRDELLVQGWLPATQAILKAVSSLGGGVVEARLALAAVASLGVAAGVAAADKLGGRVAAWSFLVLSCFAPALVWTGAMYQEGTYLAVLYVGLALAVYERWTLADLVIGLVGLVRYEGWPAVAIWIVWRRDPKALAASWGILVWLSARYALGLRGAAFSPVDFDDWEGLASRTTLGSWLHDAWKWVRMEWLSGGVTVVALAGLGAWTSRQQRVVRYMIVNLAAQLAALAGWLAGLEVATYRMLVVPTAVATLPAALGAAWAWQRWPRLRLVLVGALAVFLGVAAWESQREGRVEMRGNAWESFAARRMAGLCADCLWRVTPREGIGTRDRHDGCEVLQGITGWRHGQEFVCATWPGAEELETRGEVVWREVGGYLVDVTPRPSRPPARPEVPDLPSGVPGGAGAIAVP